MEFWQALLILLVFLIAGLTAYSLYLRAKIATARGRFAAVVVFAIFTTPPTTVLAVSQSHLTDNIISILGIFWGRDLSTSPISQYSPLIDALLISTMSVTVVVGLVIFGRSAIRSWDPLLTELDASLFERSAPQELFSIAFNYIQFRIDGNAELPINPKSIHLATALDDPPDTPVKWPDICRQLLMDTQSEISLPKDDWSSDLKCWVGLIKSKYTGDNTRLLVVPTASEIGTSTADTVSQLNFLPDISNVIVYLCPDIDRSVDREAPEYGSNFRIISRTSISERALDLSLYCAALQREFTETAILGTSLNLSDVYVPAIAEDRGVNRPITEIIDAWARDEKGASNRREHLSLFGDFGQGKSTAILHYCAQWAERRLKGELSKDRIPLLIPLRGRDPGGLPPSQFLAAWGDQYALPGKALMNLVISGRAVLIFEGFDEINNAGTKDERVRQFNALWKFAHPRSKLIFTGRPNFFVDRDEENRLLRIGVQSAMEGRVASRPIRLRFFDTPQVKESLRSFPQSVSEGIVRRFKSHSDFRQIASRPSMLPLIAVIWPDLQNLIDQKKSLTTAAIIQRYVTYEYTRKDNEIQDDERSSSFSRSQNYIRIPSRIKDFFLVSISRAIVRSGSGEINSISSSLLDETVRTTSSLTEAYFGKGSIPEETLYFAKLRELARDARRAGEIAERITSELRATGLLVRNTSGGGEDLCFPHMQFYEYYLARAAIIAMERRFGGVHDPIVDDFLMESQPCTVIENSLQAKKFFAQMSRDEWYDRVFTRKFGILPRAQLFAYLVLAIPALSSTHTLLKASTVRKVIGIAAAILLAISSIVIVASVLIAFAGYGYYFVLILGAFFTTIAILASFGERVLIDVELWVSLVRDRFRGTSAEHCRTVLGSVTTALLHIFESRRADTVIQSALWARQLREELKEAGSAPQSRRKGPV